jgi:hypothetical protein
VARLTEATAPPARSAVARLREARGRVPQAGRSGRARRLTLAGLGSALMVGAVLAGRARRRRAPGVREALGRALGSCWPPSRLPRSGVAVAGGPGRSADLAAAATAVGVRLHGAR